MECISELPADVLKHIVSFRFWEPKYLKLKHSQALRKIQRKYKARNILKTIYSKKGTTFVFGVSRDVPFLIKRFEYMVEQQKDLFLDILRLNGVDKYNMSGVYLEVVVSLKDGYEYCNLRSLDNEVSIHDNDMERELHYSIEDILEQIDNANVDADRIHVKSCNTCLVIDRYVWTLLS